MKFGIGQPVRRKEDVRFVTGSGRYTDDIVLERQAYAYFLRSPHAHARIIGVDATAAAAAPGVVGVLTHASVDQSMILPVAPHVKNRDGTPLRMPAKTLLPADKARFCGEALAMVVAESAAEAKDAAELILVEYEPLPATGDAARAGQSGQIWDNIPGNLTFDWADGDENACQAAFAKAAKIVSVEVVQNRVFPSPMEPRGAIGVFDPGTERYTLYTGTQGGASIRDRLCGVLKLPKEGLRVITPDVGGGFGQKTSVTAEQALVLLAAKKFGRPVKWIGERTEAFLADAHGRDVRMKAELALDGDARVLAARVDSIANLGAYLSTVGPNVVTSAGFRILGGVYRLPTAYVRVRGYLTNTATISAYRGAGRPEAAYLTDRLLDAAAAAFGLDRIEIRRRNLIAKEELPYKNWKGLSFDSGDFVGNLEQAALRAEWVGFEARRKESLARGKLRGCGVSYYVEVSGGPPGPEPSAIRFNDDGSVDVYLGTQSNGQGHETSFAQLVAGRLGVEFERVAVHEGDTDFGMEGMNTVGSRSLQTAGSALARATDAIIAKGKQAAAQILQAGGAEIVFEIEDGVGRFKVQGTTRAISVEDLGQTLKRETLSGFENGLDESASYEGPPTFPNGCHICEVEIDPETGTVAIVRYTIVDDLGRIINPLIVWGQVHGGVAQGLGQALMENVVYDAESGQLLTATLLDYALPRAEDMPRVNIVTNEIPCTTNPLGSKGAGEAGTVGALPAMVSAISDALGVAHIDMPATPEKVWRATRTASRLQRRFGVA